jgi:hypothetical protein
MLDPNVREGPHGRNGAGHCQTPIHSRSIPSQIALETLSREGRDLANCAFSETREAGTQASAHRASHPDGQCPGQFSSRPDPGWPVPRPILVTRRSGLVPTRNQGSRVELRAGGCPGRGSLRPARPCPHPGRDHADTLLGVLPGHARVPCKVPASGPPPARAYVRRVWPTTTTVRISREPGFVSFRTGPIARAHSC